MVTLSLVLLCGFVSTLGYSCVSSRRNTYREIFSVAGVGQTYNFATGRHIHSAFVRTLTIWNGLVFSFSLATNITATSLIALRVW